jgi:hypothetical protein
MNIIRAIWVDLQLIDLGLINLELIDYQLTKNISIDCYKYPDGSKWFKIMEVSWILGFHCRSLGRIISETNNFFGLTKQDDIRKYRLYTYSEKKSRPTTLISEQCFAIAAMYAMTIGQYEATDIFAYFNNLGMYWWHKGAEHYVQYILLAMLGNNARKEVITPVGRIDILTNTELIEIKTWKKWKDALGQVLCYGTYYPSHQKRIHFYGKIINSEYIDLVKTQCRKHKIIITPEITYSHEFGRISRRN